MLQYLDVVNKVGSILNVDAFLFHFFAAKASIDTCFKVSNGIVTTCNSVPALTTTSVNSITNTTASSGGNITNDGGTPVTARGVCWSTSQNPTIANSKTTDGTGIGSFTSSINGLTANTTYYVRAYATNSTGTAYGNQESFTTSTQAISPIIGKWRWYQQDIDGVVTPRVGSYVWFQENGTLNSGIDGSAGVNWNYHPPSSWNLHSDTLQLGGESCKVISLDSSRLIYQRTKYLPSKVYYYFDRY